VSRPAPVAKREANDSLMAAAGSGARGIIVVCVLVSQQMRYEEVATLMTRIDVGQARCAAGAASIVSEKIRREG
jgi:hypothetical protein